MTGRQAIVSVGERVIDADPAVVWSLLANPERIAEWSGLVLVGYMGTELPQAGQNVFVKRRSHWAKPKRVEIKSWDAGAGIKCVVHTTPETTGFDLTIHPEVEPEAIATRVRLTQRSSVAGYTRALAAWWVDKQLEGKLDRIERAARR